MAESVLSKGGVRVRLTSERWAHITDEHCELAGMRHDVLETLADPSRIVAGKHGELMAVQEMADGKHLIVVYREQQMDGFVITAFLTRRTDALGRRGQIWPQ